MTRTVLWIRRRAFFRPSCRLYSQLLLLYPDDLYLRYVEEMQWVFQEELKRASRIGFREYMAVWCSVLRDTLLQVGPLVTARFSIMSIAFAGTLAIMLPVLLAIPTSFPKGKPSCMTEVYASSRVQPTSRSEAFEGVDDDTGTMQDALSVHARPPAYKQRSRSEHSWRLARSAHGASGQTTPHRSQDFER